MRDASFPTVEDLHGAVLTPGEDEVAFRRVDLDAMDGPPVLPVVKVVLGFRRPVQVPYHHCDRGHGGERERAGE